MKTFAVYTEHTIVFQRCFFPQFTGHLGPITCLVVSPNQKYMVSGSSDNSMLVSALNALMVDPMLLIKLMIGLAVCAVDIRFNALNICLILQIKHYFQVMVLRKQTTGASFATAQR